MRVLDQIYVVRGARRSAVYDMNKSLVWACSDLEANLIKWMARGLDWQDYRENLPRDEILTAVSTMRRRGWLAPGLPQSKDIELVVGGDISTPDMLKHVWIELTDACNLSCKHCYSSSSPLVGRSTELSLEQLLDSITKLSQLDVRTLTYIGGEPTLRKKEIEALCDHAALTLPGVKQRIFSNLAITNLAPSIVPLARRFDLQIGTSLYGMSAETHDSMTGQTGSWQRTITNVRILLEAKIDLFVGFYTMDHANEQRASQWLASVGVSNFRVLRPSKVGRAKESFDFVEPARANKRPDRMYFGSSTFDWTSGHNCFKDHLAIASDGSVRPCIMMRDISYGRLPDISQLAEIFDTQAFKRMARLGKDQIDGCSVCEFRYGCFDCRPDAMQGSKDLSRKPACGYDPRLEL